MIRLRVLGALDLRDADGRAFDAILAQPKRLALLVHLALARPYGFQRRDVLVAMFWPALDQARARNALSQALHHLRRALGSELFATRGDEEIAIVEARLWCDARRFMSGAEEGRIEEALDLYGGDLLPGFFIPDCIAFERWQETERQRLKDQAAALAWKRADASAACGDAPDATHWARFAHGLASDDEGSVRHLIAVLARIGDRAGALRAFDDYARHLAAEFDVQPADETRRLIDTVRSEAATPVPVPQLTAGPRKVEPQPTDAIEARSSSSAASSDSTSVAMSVATSVATSAETSQTSTRNLWTAQARWTTHRGLLVGGALITVTVMLILAARARHDETVMTQPTASIAVMPFLDLSQDRRDEYLSDGMAEELSEALSRVPGLRVTSRTSAFAFKGTAVDARTIGKALGVATILEGSVRRDGNTLRVTAQLIDARTGYHRWSATLDRAFTDVFAVEDELAREIVSALALQLAESREHRTGGSLMARHVTANLEAYTDYLRGRHAWNERTATSLANAINWFERAIAADSLYASAYAGLADAYNVMVAQTYTSPDSGFARAKTAALRALALDSSLAEAHAALGFIHLFHDWNGPLARRELDVAVALDSNYSTARLYRAFLYVASGQADDAVTEIRRAQLLDPLSRIINARVGFVLVLAHHFDDAIAAEARAIELDSANGPAYWSLGNAYAGTRRFDAAIRAFSKARALSGLMLGEEGFVFATSGHVDQARRFLADLDARERTTYVDPYERALVYAGLGDRERALHWLQLAVDRHSASMVWLKSEPMLDGLRNDSRFVALVRAVGL